MDQFFLGGVEIQENTWAMKYVLTGAGDGLKGKSTCYF